MRFFTFPILSLFIFLFSLNASEAKEIPFKKSGTKSVEKQSEYKTVDALKQSSHSKEMEAHQKNCEASGQSHVYSKHYKLKNPLSFANKISTWVDESLSYVKKGVSEQCPKHCEQINNYQTSSKIYPQNVIKESCKGEQSKETYAFNKKFFFEKNRKSVKKTHQEMTEWILATFVYPYFPLPFLEPTEESVENNLSKACPSCSFYLDYTYKYTEDNNLDLDIKARCGDTKKFMFDFKAEFVLINNWSCRKPGKEKPLRSGQ